MFNFYYAIIFSFFALILGSTIVHSRTVHNYVMKKPGDAAPIGRNRQLHNQNDSYMEEIDEDVLAKEQFARIKMLELEGREPYQENRKTTITRTY